MNQFYPIIILTNNKDLEVDNNYLLLNNNEIIPIAKKQKPNNNLVTEYL